MHIEMLTFEGCRNAESARELVRRAVQVEAVDATIEFIEVNTRDVAPTNSIPRIAVRSGRWRRRRAFGRFQGRVWTNVPYLPSRLGIIRSAAHRDDPICDSPRNRRGLEKKGY